MIDTFLQLHWTIRMVWCVGVALTLVHIKTEDEERHGRWSIKSQILIAGLLYIGWPCFWIGYLAVDLWDTFKARFEPKPEEKEQEEEKPPAEEKVRSVLKLTTLGGKVLTLDGVLKAVDAEGGELSDEEAREIFDGFFLNKGWKRSGAEDENSIP